MTERYRWPWYWLVVLAVLALAGTIAISISSRSRLRAIDESFVAGQMLRVGHVEHTIDDYFAHAKQLAEVTGSFAAASRQSQEHVRWYTSKIFEGRADPHVFGLGVFYAPFAFDGRNRLVDIYDHVRGSGAHSKYDHPHGGFEEVVFASPGHGAEDYTVETWYRGAVAARGRIIYAGPYLEQGQRYISVARAFYRGTHLLGVASVDTLASWFRGMLQDGIAGGDVAFVQTPGIAPWISSAPVPPAGTRYRDASVPLIYSTAAVHLRSDRAPLERAERETVTLAAVAIAVLWILTLMTAVGLVQRWRTRTVNLAMRGEIARARRTEGELRKAAFTDELTELPNRLALIEAISRLFKDGSAESQGVYLIDLDRFNLTNETLGHSAGDELLCVIGERLDALFARAFVARLGGDEFAVLGDARGDVVDTLASEILACVADPVLLYGRTIYPRASIGVAIISDAYREPQEVLRDAEIAMYAAKKLGRGRYALFDTEMRDRIAEESELEIKLRRAIERKEIVPAYQPIVDLRTHEVVSFEALARWQDDGAPVSAAVFVPFAESRGFIHEIDALMLRSILGQSHAILALFPNSTISINVSAPQLTLPNYAVELVDVLMELEVAPSRIHLEITETTMMTQTEEARQTLRRLADAGIKVVLDDFGTGYSSLGYLQRLSISGLKIDRSFVELIDSDERAREIVRSVVALAQALNLTTTAEGVERASQVHELALLGVKYGQGFFFSHARPLAELAQLATPGDRAMTANSKE